MAVIRVLEAISAGFGVVWQRGEEQDVSDDLARLLVTQRRAEYVSPPAAPADWLVPVMKKVDEAADQSSVSGGMLAMRAIADVVGSSIPERALVTLRAAIASGTCVGAFAGDSNTEDGNNIDFSLNRLGNHRDVLMRMLEDSYPSVNFTFRNYGLSSRNLGMFASSAYVGQSGTENIGTGFLRTSALHPTWGDGSGSVAGKSWINHVRDAAPDFVVLHFGLNPQSDSDFVASLDSVRTAMMAWPKQPTVIIVAPMSPAIGFQDQYRPNRLGRLIRSYARHYGRALVDTHAMHRILRDGVHESGGWWEYHGTPDLRWSGSWELHAGTVTAPDPYTRVFGPNSFLRLPVDAHNFQVQVTSNITNAAVTGNLHIRARDESHVGEPGTTPQFVWGQQSGFSVAVFDGASNVGSTSVNAVDGDTIVFKGVGPLLEIWRRANGATGYTLMAKARQWKNNAGGRIMIGAFGGTTGGLVVSNPRIQIMRPATFVGQFMDREILGGEYSPGNFATRWRAGGNGANHPSAMGTALLFHGPYAALMSALARV